MTTMAFLSRPTPIPLSSLNSPMARHCAIFLSRAVTGIHPIVRTVDSFADNPSERLFDRLLAFLFVSGLVGDPLFAGRVVKKLCSRATTLPRALLLISSLPFRPDAFIYNAVLRGLLGSGDTAAAFRFYRRCVYTGLEFAPPNRYTFPVLSKLFSKLALPLECRGVHGKVLRIGLDGDIFVRNSLIHMYSVLGKISAARRLFTGFSKPDLVTWNSMINGCVKNGLIDIARKLFDEMPDRDLYSWNAMIAGLVAAGDMDSAKELFEKSPERNIVSWNTIINGYARLGKVRLARDLFDAMPGKNHVSWNVILALYARTKQYEECLRLFDTMLAGGSAAATASQPSAAILVSALTACAHLGKLQRGRQIHSMIQEFNGTSTLRNDILLSTTLLTMYAKCGDMASAEEIFQQIGDCGVVTWNSMISGYGANGRGRDAFNTFLRMKKQGPRPNRTTFICILDACAHNGMVPEGRWCFDSMVRFYGIEPEVEHLGCMVKLLGRAAFQGHLEDLVKKAGVEPSASPELWGALAVAAFGASKVGKEAERKMVEAGSTDMGTYVLLSNTYAEQGRWAAVETVRKMMMDARVFKSAGVSMVDVETQEIGKFLGQTSACRVISADVK